ncbi:TPA: DUF2511 domain-containing protein [Klebsiella pneumoniae]|uniref:YebY family protein n=1 Tax=Raoultella planticola TaxID=575 RepID=UPI0021482DF4|nr:YebY family protein [Raoultella planticola]HBR3209718.1 DUF2511 domain-containing protein [Klebsiella pneumoniae]HBR5288532.1 DUF2511 domain-containing protein [Klebsiella pneumoniae]HBS6659279.1 DUF2511 domain-containing protein [Klebsiella pneumoniae]HBS6946314.1 DUF2511 domain-containing protein [Klebsiella pneumoniae]HBS7325003.1 DUF2511 domain-containing protein [Klebsiella pneumoniae]
MLSKTNLLALIVGALLSTSALAVPFKAIEKNTFGGNWPFSADEVQLQCLDGNPYVMNFDDNKIYALTGSAKVKGKSFGALPLDNSKFWLDDKKSPGMKVGLGDVIEAALDLCGK